MAMLNNQMVILYAIRILDDKDQATWGYLGMVPVTNLGEAW